MREIKFRARLDEKSFPKSHSKGWVYGFVSKYKGDWSMDTYGNYGGFVANGSYLAIDPETIGQYTGLTDKNGKELYFNDYIHVYFGGKYNKTVPIKDIYDLSNLIRLIEDHGATFKIYGNAYDNPELLEDAN